MTRGRLRELLLAGSLLGGPVLADSAPGDVQAADHPLAETGWNLTSLPSQPATDGPMVTLGFGGAGMVAGGEKAAPVPAASGGIRFDLNRLDASGLQGPPDGLRALHYELCVPDRPEALRAALAIDPTLEIQAGSPGRIGCGEGQALAIGHTHQPGYRAVLERLAALPGVGEIREAVFE